jgi:nitroreductase
MKVTLICMQCQPLRKFWNQDVPGICRLTPMISLFGAGIPHFVLEVFILFCPLIEIWRLHLSTTKKLAVAAMFMSGILVCCSALGTIIHTVALAKKVDQDLTWDGLDDQIWAVCDVNLASFASEYSIDHQLRTTQLILCSITTPPPPDLPLIRRHLQRAQIDAIALQKLRRFARNTHLRQWSHQTLANPQAQRHGFDHRIRRRRRPHSRDCPERIIDQSIRAA